MADPRLQRAPLEALLEQALVGAYVIQDNRLVYANPRLAELFGYQLADLLALTSILTLVDESDRGEVTERVRLRLSGALATSTHHMRGRRRDGTMIELEVYGTTAEHDGRPAIVGTMIDMTERLRRERDLEARERRYRDLFENAGDVVFTYDLEGRITSLNRMAEQITGYVAADACGMSVADFVVVSDRERVREAIRRQARDRRDMTNELTIMTRSGAERTLEVSSRIVERDGRAVEIHGIARDVTARKEEERALRSLTIVDDLTGLYNRRGFLTLAERHLKLAGRKRQGVFLLFADVDGLKNINDTFGHLEGDRALSDSAEILRRSFRSADIIARLGGDEFTVFPLEASAASSDRLISRLDEQLRAHNETHASRGYRLSLSVGIARFDPDGSWSIDQLLEHADRALYDQKRSRRKT
jgi:diguanylate cyclase (GGDEF)-like protein/PAS domain S-box-containing protein